MGIPSRLPIFDATLYATLNATTATTAPAGEVDPAAEAAAVAGVEPVATEIPATLAPASELVATVAPAGTGLSEEAVDLTDKLYEKEFEARAIALKERFRDVLADGARLQPRAIENMAVIARSLENMAVITSTLEETMMKVSADSISTEALKRTQMKALEVEFLEKFANLIQDLKDGLVERSHRNLPAEAVLQVELT